MSTNNSTGEAEEIIFSMRTHPKSLVPPVIIGLLTIAAAIAAGMFIPSAGMLGWLQLGAWAFCTIMFLGASVAPFLRWRSSTFTVTNRQVRVRSGVLRRSGSDIPLGRITNVETDRGILDQIFHCGTLVIRDAGSSDGLYFDDIPNVVAVRQALSDLAYEAGGGAQGR